MSAFLTELSVSCVDDLANEGRGIWRINSEFKYYSDLIHKLIIVEPGFLTDFASVPRLPLAYWFLGDSCHKAAVIHDWLYHHHEMCDEQTANKILLEACKVQGVAWWRRGAVYAGVAVGGTKSWIDDSRGNGHNIVDGRIV